MTEDNLKPETATDANTVLAEVGISRTTLAKKLNRKTKEKRSLVKSFNHLKINKNGKSIN